LYYSVNSQQLARALEQGDLSNLSFPHASHLGVAWVYLHESASIGNAIDKMRATLRRVTAVAGKPEKYHETITIFWMCVLASLGEVTGESDLEKILAANPELLEKDFPLHYYSRDLLFSERARTTWVAPDLKPLRDDCGCSPSR
jgi:hypothetical protein